MACVSRLIVSVAANSNSFSFKTHHFNRKLDASVFRVKASSTDEEDCNVEECAPDKEVGKVSMEWLAGEKTRVAGTFPPKKKGWTGYIEKDTAGQTNIYSVEPTVYVSKSVLSSGNAGSSSEGAENTAAIAAGLALIAIAAASSILLQVGKNSPQVPTSAYSGPSLSYYVSMFKPVEVIQASEPSKVESPPPSESLNSVSAESLNSVAEIPPPTEPQTLVSEIPQVQAEGGNLVESTASNVDTTS